MQRLEKVIYMLNRQHESLKQESDSYLPRVGSYYSLLGQFYYKQGQFENANKWVRFVENNPKETALQLTPMAVNNTLNIALGRLKKTNISDRHIQLFIVGDQLLWGAAEPLRRMLNIGLARV